MFSIYTQFGFSSKYSYNKKLYNSIFHKFDQQQGQFRRSWSYFFFTSLNDFTDFHMLGILGSFV